MLRVNLLSNLLSKSLKLAPEIRHQGKAREKIGKK